MKQFKKLALLFVFAVAWTACWCVYFWKPAEPLPRVVGRVSRVGEYWYGIFFFLGDGCWVKLETGQMAWAGDQATCKFLSPGDVVEIEKAGEVWRVR